MKVKVCVVLAALLVCAQGTFVHTGVVWCVGVGSSNSSEL